MKKAFLYYLGWFIFALPSILSILLFLYTVYRAGMLLGFLKMLAIVLLAAGCIIGGIKLIDKYEETS